MNNPGEGPAMPPDVLAVHQLGPLGPMVGEGGQAKVYELPDLRLVDVPGRLVYKQYKPGQTPAHGVSRLVSVRTRLRAQPDKLARLDAITAWPARQVVDAAGVVRGLVLPRIPAPFFHTIHRPGTGTTKKIPCEVQFLFIAPDRAVRTNMPAPTPDERLKICRDFAGALAFLHGPDVDVAFGDINARNHLYRLDAEPTVMFVDCDAARPRGDMASVAQLNAPDWDPPEGGDVLSKSTDLYKLGLFVLRCLTPDIGSSINRDPNQARAVLDTNGLALMHAALGNDPHGRPTADEWHRHLRRRLGQVDAKPQLTAQFDRTIIAAGEPLTLTWAADEADTVEVSGIGCGAMSFSGSAGGGVVQLRPTRTGTVTVTARNTLGEHSSSSPVVVFTPANFGDLLVPMPRLDPPGHATAPLPSVAAVLPLTPAGRYVPLPPMAQVIGPWTEPVVEQIPAPIDPVGPPPTFGFGPFAGPLDIAAIMTGAPDTEPNPEVDR
jgi:hypothetical protein